MKRAGTDLRLATRDNGAFELPMLPGASACAFRFLVLPPKKSPAEAGAKYLRWRSSAMPAPIKPA